MLAGREAGCLWWCAIAEVLKGVGDVLAERVEELFAVVKGVGDVLA